MSGDIQTKQITFVPNYVYTKEFYTNECQEIFKPNKLFVQNYVYTKEIYMSGMLFLYQRNLHEWNVRSVGGSFQW